MTLNKFLVNATASGLWAACALAAFLTLSVSQPANAQLWPWPWGSDTSSNETAYKTKALLPALSGDAKAVTVSGLSAGAYMSIQLHMAFSSSISGVGSIAGGPWNCAEGSVYQARDACMSDPSKVDVAALLRQLKAAERVGLIDALSNLVNSRVYLYNSPDDAVILPPMNEKEVSFYSKLIPASQIKSETSVHAAHGMPTLDFGNSCNLQDSPYLVNCKFDAAGETLKQLYPSLTLGRKAAVKTSLKMFDQSAFAGSEALLGQTGWVYVPATCTNGGCPVHVVLHGCLQTPEHVKTTFVTHAGYNEWAEGSGIIVLYPQARKSLMNPNGCFDWFGYTGADYANKRGPQMRAIKAMIDRILSN